MTNCCGLLLLANSLSQYTSLFNISFSNDQFQKINPANWITDSGLTQVKLPALEFSPVRTQYELPNSLKCNECFIEKLKEIKSQGLIIIESTASVGYIRVDVDMDNVFFNCPLCNFVVSGVDVSRNLNWTASGIHLSIVFSYNDYTQECKIIRNGDINFDRSQIKISFECRSCQSKTKKWLQLMENALKKELMTILVDYFQLILLPYFSNIVESHKSLSCTKAESGLNRLIKDQFNICL